MLKNKPEVSVAPTCGSDIKKPFKSKRSVLGLSAVVSAGLVIAGCSGTEFDFENSQAVAAAQVAPSAIFDPAAGALPFPNNAFFAGTMDGTLNIPVADPADFGNPQVALNAVDGFSTTEAMTTQFAMPLDPTSLAIGSSVRVFELAADPLTLAPQGVVRELDGTEVVAVAAGDGSTLAVVPLRPLAERTSYMVLATDGITDATGRNVQRAALFDIIIEEGDQLDPEGAAGALIPLAQLSQGLIQLGASQGVNPDSVVMAWNFTTQSTTPVLQAVAGSAVASPLAVQPSGLTTLEVGGMGAADISVGVLDVPYYLQAPTAENPQGPINGFWTGAGGSNLTVFNPQPEVQSTQTIPVLMTVPNANSGQAMPDAGWPIAIFQHGITRNRTDALALADAMAVAGFAVIAIDIPLHGITDTASPLFVAGAERTFDFDVVNNESGAPGPDGTIDDSGNLFINLTNLLNLRDNFRQGIADVLTLSASVGNLPMIDASRKVFVGHSLGAIIGSTALAFDSSFASATLASPGGGLARLFAGSPAFGPAVAAGLAGAGIDINGPAGQQFLTAAQTLVDSADPVNHASATAANGPIHMIQIIPDQVVTGVVSGAALSGTEPLASLMGLPRIGDTSSGNSLVRFLGGTHGSILDPTADLAVTTEIQTQVATFAASAGQLLPIGDTSLIEAPAP